MASFSSLLTSTTGLGFFYTKTSRHTTHNFNQEGQALYRNHPRLPFEYYISINLNRVGTAGTYIKDHFNTTDMWNQVMPLVKSIEMPSFKIQTEPLNQYNRKRLSQTHITYDSVKAVFHDVADGKTLKFWEMYYRYYFSDGDEPGKNSKPEQPKATNLLKSLIPAINPNILGLPSAVKNLFGAGTPKEPPVKLGKKESLENIVQDTLSDHSFGYNLGQVGTVRNLIQSIDIFQVHGGRFNQVRLVNPRISSFAQDTLNYATDDKPLEVVFTFDYEYAYYIIQNLELGKNDSNNSSSIDQYAHGDILELPALAFNARFLDFIESNNPLLNSDNPILSGIGKKLQSKVGSVTGSFVSDKVVRKASASVLNGLAKISPTPYSQPANVKSTTRPFGSSAVQASSSSYQDVNRAGSNG